MVLIETRLATGHAPAGPGVRHHTLMEDSLDPIRIELSRFFA